jgi:hypothetical protein
MISLTSLTTPSGCVAGTTLRSTPSPQKPDGLSSQVMSISALSEQKLNSLSHFKFLACGLGSTVNTTRMKNRPYPGFFSLIRETNKETETLCHQYSLSGNHKAKFFICCLSAYPYHHLSHT